VTQRQVPLKVEPNATSRALIPAQALGTQTVTAGVVLHSSADPIVQVGARDAIEVNLRPSWEGIGTGIIAALFILIFGAGITRQVLKRRRGRRDREAATGTGTDVGAGTGDAG
jgi:hypothetical protein